MRISILIVTAIFLAACSPSAAAPAVPTVPLATVDPGLPPSSCTAVSTSQSRAEYIDTLPYGDVTAEDWQRGPADAAVTLTEYSDFQCPFCAQLAGVLQELEARYPEQINVVYRHFPLIGTPEQPLHDKAAISMQAAEAAGLQGKFWEMHDALFAAQTDWTAMSAEDFEAWLLDTAEDLELDTLQFMVDLHDEENAAAAQAAWEAGQELQLGGTPFLLINGLPYSGPLDVVSLDTILQLEFLRSREFNECPEMQLEAGANYTATLHTAKGDIVVELFPGVAPMAVNSFVFLAENDWFDNVTFHRVLPGFVAQAGDPTGTGYGGPGYSFAIEVDPNLSFDRPGLLAMANSGPTSNGSQFFITYAAAEHLNGQFTIFGEVIQGMDVVENLTARDPSIDPNLPPGDLILDVTIEAH
jgi:cyclophilin family peptidyl-prolyl cis-trans isomerase/protein-disulfide isomerase